MRFATILFIWYLFPSLISCGKRELAVKNQRKVQNNEISSPSLQPVTIPLPRSLIFTLPPFLSPFTLPPIISSSSLPPILSPSLIASFAPAIVNSFGPAVAPAIEAHLPTLNPAIPPFLAPFFNSPVDIPSLTLPPAFNAPQLIQSFGPAMGPSLSSFGPAIVALLPSAQPLTVSPATSTSPATYHPTAQPSFVPSTVIVATPTPRPSIAPTLTDTSIAYAVTQTFSGITTSTYNQAKTINNGVIARTVSTYVTQITTSDVTVNSVDSADTFTRRRFLRNSFQSSSAGSAITLSYTISIPSITTAGFATSSAAYTTTSSELIFSIKSGAFNQTMHALALITPGCTLVNAQAGNATLGNYTQAAVVSSGGSSSSSGNSAGSGFIAGVVTAVAIGIALLLLVVFYILKKRAKEGRLSNESRVSSVKAERAPQPSVKSTIENPLAPTQPPTAPAPKPVIQAKRAAKDNFGNVGDDEDDGPAFFMRDSVLDGFDDQGL